MQSFTFDGKQISIFPGADPDSPVIYLHTFGEEGAEVFQILHEMNCPDVSLVAITGLVWNHEMAPWDCPAVFAKGDAFTGGAENLSTCSYGLYSALKQSTALAADRSGGVSPGILLQGCLPFTLSAEQISSPELPACPVLSGFQDSRNIWNPILWFLIRTAFIFLLEIRSIKQKIHS